MTQSDNKKAPYKRGDIVQYKEGNGVALVVEKYRGAAGINWIVAPTSGGFDDIPTWGLVAKRKYEGEVEEPV